MKLFLSLFIVGCLLSNIVSAEFRPLGWHTNQQEKFLCSSVFAIQLKKQVLQLPNDKTKHCALSCFLSWRCGPFDAWEIGILKEVFDLFGAGSAEWLDLEADSRGILLGQHSGLGRRADRQCITGCKKIYPAN
ncbi:MAG: hypothetical protein HYV97_16780 [Bdellovibrio sp.]|nr:hypothetical protein [Bdellovibrio sp.]